MNKKILQTLIGSAFLIGSIFNLYADLDLRNIGIENRDKFVEDSAKALQAATIVEAYSSFQQLVGTYIRFSPQMDFLEAHQNEDMSFYWKNRFTITKVVNPAMTALARNVMDAILHFNQSIYREDNKFGLIFVDAVMDKYWESNDIVQQHVQKILNQMDLMTENMSVDLLEQDLKQQLNILEEYKAKYPILLQRCAKAHTCDFKKEKQDL